MQSYLSAIPSLNLKIHDNTDEGPLVEGADSPHLTAALLKSITEDLGIPLDVKVKGLASGRSETVVGIPPF